MAKQRYSDFCPRCKESKPVIYDERGNPYFGRCEEFVNERSKMPEEGFRGKIFRKFANH